MKDAERLVLSLGAGYLAEHFISEARFVLTQLADTEVSAYRDFLGRLLHFLAQEGRSPEGDIFGKRTAE